MKKADHSPLLNLFIFIFSALLCFIFLEVSARIYLFHFASEKSFALNASLRQLETRARQDSIRAFKKTYHRYLGYYTTPNYRNGDNHHNSLGYRGEELMVKKTEGKFRIVCLGGSTTYTSGVKDYRNAYPALLQRNLNERGFDNVQVINAGVPGWSSWESLINFEFRVLDLDPDMIIIYHGVNDIHPRFVWPPQAYRGDNSGRSLPAATDIFMPSILEYSTLIRFILIRLGKSRPHIDINKTIDRWAETFYADDFQHQKMRQIYPKGIFKEIPATKMLAINKPIYFRRNIENIVYIAQQYEIAVVLATFSVSPLFENEPRSTSPEYVAAYQEHNTILKKIAAKTEAYLFDFASVFPDDKKYTHDGRHVTREGAKLKAAMFTDFIIKNNLVK